MPPIFIQPLFTGNLNMITFDHILIAVVYTIGVFLVGILFGRRHADEVKADLDKVNADLSSIRSRAQAELTNAKSAVATETQTINSEINKGMK